MTRWTLDLVKKFFKENQCELLEKEYKNARTKMKYKCSCGNVSETTLDRFKKGHRCNACGTKKASDKAMLTHEEFLSRLPPKCEFKIHGIYTGALEDIRVQHIKCGRIFNTKASYLTAGTVGCPACKGTNISTAKKKRKSKKFEDFFSKHTPDFNLVSDYDGVHNPVRIKHVKCGHEFNRRPNDMYKKGVLCPNCEGASKGEKLISQILKYSEEEYIEQYSFDDCVSRAKLRFDFAVLNKDNTVKYLIEFNGIQHYQPTRFGGTSRAAANKNFQDQVKRDNIKREYCEKNKIKLIEISYLDYVKLDFFFKFHLIRQHVILSFLDFVELLNSKVFYCTVPIEVISKSNSVMSGRGRTYIPKKFKEFEDKLKEYVTEAMDQLNFNKMLGPVVFHMNNYHSTKRVKDVTNSFKSVCDSLNEVLYKDDNQIVYCSATKDYDKYNPRIEIIALELDKEHLLIGAKDASMVNVKTLTEKEAGEASDSKKTTKTVSTTPQRKKVVKRVGRKAVRKTSGTSKRSSKQKKK